MLEFDIIVLDGNETIIAGTVWWEQEPGQWGFETDFDKIRTFLEEVQEKGTVNRYVSVMGEGIIGDAIVPTKPEHPKFIHALSDALSIANVLELRFRQNCS